MEPLEYVNLFDYSFVHAGLRGRELNFVALPDIRHHVLFDDVCAKRTDSSMLTKHTHVLKGD